MTKHVPVLLDKVLLEFEKFKDLDNLNVFDGTLGQAGHSFEIFQKMKKGKLISIDLDIDSIKWVAEHNEFESENFSEAIYKKEELEKVWYLKNDNFSNIQDVMQFFSIKNFDFILLDLGFSNYQLGKNLGISYDKPNQRLDMRYNLNFKKNAFEVLNFLEKEELIKIFQDLGQIEEAKNLVDEILNKRKIYPIERVKDLLNIVTKKKFPKNYKVKVFQALRSFVNEEIIRLQKFLDRLDEILSLEGAALIITFNSLEEKIVTESKLFNKTLEPNINEIINNTQSRSAKLHILKKTK